MIEPNHSGAHPAPASPFSAPAALAKSSLRRLLDRTTWGVAVAAALFSPLAAFAAQRTLQTVTLPASALQRADGQSISLSKAFADGRPVVLTFMYSSCQTVCPVNNQVLVELEQLLANKRERVNLVSISIDPDHDSVQRLTAYAKRTGHRGSFFTGDPGTSETVQRAFDSWRGDKQNHEPVFFLGRAAGAKAQWVRLSGFVTPSELLNELSTLAPDLGLKPGSLVAAAGNTTSNKQPQPTSLARNKP